MTDTALEAAASRMAELERNISAQRNTINDANTKLSRLEKEHADVAAWIEMWHNLAGTQGRPVAAERTEINLPVQKAVKRTRPKNPGREYVVDKAVEIIREWGHPMGRQTLFEALAERGIAIFGKDPEMVLSTMLWRSKHKIVRLTPYGYWPADESYPDADYISNLDDNRLPA